MVYKYSTNTVRSSAVNGLTVEIAGFVTSRSICCSLY